MGRPRNWERREPLPAPREPWVPPPLLVPLPQLISNYRELRRLTAVARERGDKQQALLLCQDASKIAGTLEELGISAGREQLKTDWEWASRPWTKSSRRSMRRARARVRAKLYKAIEMVLSDMKVARSRDHFLEVLTLCDRAEEIAAQLGENNETEACRQEAHAHLEWALARLAEMEAAADRRG